MNNVISSMRILLDIKRIFKPKDSAWMNDAIRAMGEAVKGIGTSAPMEVKSCRIKVVGRRVVYPKDLFALIGAEVNGNRIPISQGVPTAQTNSGGYFFNPGYVSVPFNEGECTLHYRALPVDEKGYPLIVDNFDYFTAVRWYVMKEMLASGYEHKVFNYKDCDDKWEKHSALACNQMKMPSRDEMEALGSTWIRLFTDGAYIHNFGEGMEYGEDDSLLEGGLGLPDYVDRNRLANNS